VKLVLLRLAAVVGTLYLSISLSPSAWSKDKLKEESGTLVDSGTFGLFAGGQRVATETFSIKQSSQGSTVSSQFKSAQGEQNAEQSSLLQLTPSGDLRSYEWKELNPGKTVASVTPDESFLIEQFSDSPNSKPHDQNFLLPASTAILDDYVFVQREVLAWRYLATACRHQRGPVQCPLNQKVQFGTLNPHERSSMSVSIEFTGRDKVNIHSSQRELSRFLMKAETGDWAFWLDDQLKLVRLVNDGGTEIVRD
jgi:hypothetical protein